MMKTTPNPQKPLIISVYEQRQREAEKKGDSDSKILSITIDLYKQHHKKLQQHLTSLATTHEKYQKMNPKDPATASLLSYITILQYRILQDQKFLILDKSAIPAASKTDKILLEEIVDNNRRIAHLHTLIYSHSSNTEIQTSDSNSSYTSDCSKSKETKESSSFVPGASESAEISASESSTDEEYIDPWEAGFIRHLKTADGPIFRENDIAKILGTADRIYRESMHLFPDDQIQGISFDELKTTRAMFVSYRREAALAVAIKYFSHQKLDFGSLFQKLCETREIDHLPIQNLHSIEAMLLRSISSAYNRATEQYAAETILNLSPKTQTYTFEVVHTANANRPTLTQRNCITSSVAYEQEDVKNILNLALQICYESERQLPDDQLATGEGLPESLITPEMLRNRRFIKYRYDTAITLATQYFSERARRFSDLFRKICDTDEIDELSKKEIKHCQTMFLQSTGFWFGGLDDKFPEPSSPIN